MTLAEYIRRTILPQESKADKKAWKNLRRQHRSDSEPVKAGDQNSD